MKLYWKLLIVILITASAFAGIYVGWNIPIENYIKVDQ